MKTRIHINLGFALVLLPPLLAAIWSLSSGHLVKAQLARLSGNLFPILEVTNTITLNLTELEDAFVEALETPDEMYYRRCLLLTDRLEEDFNRLRELSPNREVASLWTLTREYRIQGLDMVRAAYKGDIAVQAEKVVALQSLGEEVMVQVKAYRFDREERFSESLNLVDDSATRMRQITAIASLTAIAFGAFLAYLLGRWFSQTGKRLGEAKAVLETQLSDITEAKQRLEKEVAERQRAEEALRRSLTFEEGLSRVSKLFTGAYMPDLRDMVSILGTVVEADASFIGVIQDPSCDSDLVVEWTGKGEPQFHLDSLDLDLRHFPSWLEKLSEGETITVRDIAQLPQKALREREFLTKLKVCSLLLVPIVSEENKFWGYIGFAHLQNKRAWSPEEPRLLQVACEILSNYLARQRAEEKLKHDAFHDGLTGLPNRTLVMDRLSHALHRLDRRREMCFAVLFIDLDRFKPINDTLGHHAGDQLLVEVAQRLLECVRLADTVARLGGDEFIVMLEELDRREEVRRIADRILYSLNEPFDVEGQEVFISCSIGIAILDQGYKDAEDVLRNADIAMYRAKLEGKSRYIMFDPSMETHTRSTFQLASDLRRAAERAQFELYYQPVISLSSERITGFEALLRWRHGERGMISPAEFIPIAEESGLMGEIGDWVLRDACRQTQAWHEMGFEDLSVAVNVSARQFYEQRLAGSIREILRDTQMQPSRLKIEITESILMENVEANIQMLHELKALGLRVLIDDFGTGYSSLSYLKRFPLDALKIDQSFTREVPDNPDDSAITATIIAMANSLNLGVIAEGVENHDQLQFLRELGCKQVQGYLFSRPVPAEEATLMLNTPHIRNVLAAPLG